MTFPREAFITEAKSLNRSEQFLEATLAYIDTLQGKELPVLFSLPHLAIEVGMQSDFIKFMINRPTDNYSYFLLQKKNKQSAPREIMAPKEELKYLQRWININILQKAKYNRYIQGFVPGTSILQNAKVHEGAKYLLKIDLLKFFDCITQHDVYKVFRSMGYIKNLSLDLSKICTVTHRSSYWKSLNDSDHDLFKSYIEQNPSVLPQGAPTSPLLANLVASRMDKRLGILASKIGFHYSRYADDLCFSSDKKQNLPSIAIVTKIVENEGFFVNKEKINFSRAGMKQYVTGLSITGSASVEKAKRKIIFSHLHFVKRFGIQSHLSVLKEKNLYKTNFKNWLLGNISFHYSINKQIGTKMFELYNKIDWDIES